MLRARRWCRAGGVQQDHHMPVDFGVGATERFEGGTAYKSHLGVAQRRDGTGPWRPIDHREFAHEEPGPVIARIRSPPAAALTLTFSKPSSIL